MTDKALAEALEKLEQLRELSEKATAGPWQADDGGCGYWGVFSDEDQDAVCYAREPKRDHSLRSYQDTSNARLIAAAVNFVREALASQHLHEGAK